VQCDVLFGYAFFRLPHAERGARGVDVMLSDPMPITSVTSFMTVPPSDLAFSVDAAMSSTSTY
jgi:hypothetical protein